MTGLCSELAISASDHAGDADDYVFDLCDRVDHDGICVSSFCTCDSHAQTRVYRSSNCDSRDDCELHSSFLDGTRVNYGSDVAASSRSWNESDGSGSASSTDACRCHRHCAVRRPMQRQVLSSHRQNGDRLSR